MRKKDKRFTITESQRETIVSLYLADVKVTEISARTNVSTYSIYKVLKERGIEKKNVSKVDYRRTITFDKETRQIIEKVEPQGLSKWICQIIKEYHKQQ